ncbi:MAG: tetratricopeptide repeat protein, partial [Flavobacteriales bacterium]
MRIRTILFVFLVQVSIFSSSAFIAHASESSILKQIAAEKGLVQKAKLYNQLSEELVNADPDKSLQYARKAIELAKKAENDIVLADAQLNLGTALYYVDEYSNGIKEVKAALKIYEEKNLKEKQGIALSMIGEIYVYWSKYDEALQYLSKARPILEASEKKADLARCYNNLGIIHKNQMNQEEALVFFKRAFSMGDDIRKGDA